MALWLNPGCDAQVSEWVVLDLFSPTVDEFDLDSQVLMLLYTKDGHDHRRVETYLLDMC